MTALPGTPAIQNAIPMPHFGITLFAAPGLGVVAAAVILGFRPVVVAPYADHEYFICGPDVMMDAIEKALGELKVPLSKYHSERYRFV
jgi:hypothetical protein